MKDSHIEDNKAYGDAILKRLAKAPARLKPYLKAFTTPHKAYVAADAFAARAKDKRDAALRAITAADDAQDASVDALAKAMVTADLGTRTKPLAAFTKQSVTELKRLAYATEAKEIAKVVKDILASKPPAGVKAACAAASKRAGGVLAAIDAATAPQEDYDDALAARDAHLPAWSLALNRLKKEAAACWADSPSKYKSVFAPVARIASPKKKRTKKPAPPPVPAVTNGIATPT